MTSRYESIPCPICGKSLDTSEIVVCPVCGAPYHKECFNTVGECQFHELHERGEDWQAPKSKEEIIDGEAPLRCSRCGTINPVDGLFCQVCGNQLNNSSEQGQYVQQQNPGMPPFPQGGQIPPGMPLNPFTTPFGGVAPDEDLDGVPAKDLAIFVGRKSHYYLPRFKDQINGKDKTINWASFVFAGWHFLYRKMYAQGIFTILLELLLSIPYALVMYNTLSVGVSTDFTSVPMQQTNDTLMTLNMICNFLTICMRFACGMLGNTLYRKHCYKKIRNIKATTNSTEEYVNKLSKKGSVALKLVCAIVIGYTLFYNILLFVIMLI